MKKKQLNKREFEEDLKINFSKNEINFINQKQIKNNQMIDKINYLNKNDNKEFNNYGNEIYNLPKPNKKLIPNQYNQNMNYEINNKFEKKISNKMNISNNYENKNIYNIHKYDYQPLFNENKNKINNKMKIEKIDKPNENMILNPFLKNKKEYIPKFNKPELNRYKNNNQIKNKNQINNNYYNPFNNRKENTEIPKYSNQLFSERNFQNNFHNYKNNRLNRINQEKRIYDDYSNYIFDDGFPLSGLGNDDEIKKVLEVVNRIDREEKNQHKKIDKNILNDLPEVTIVNYEKLNEDKKNCNICYTEFEDNKKVIILPCLHFYHSECIKKWFESKNICPNCKSEINEKNVYGDEGKHETPGQ